MYRHAEMAGTPATLTFRSGLLRYRPIGDEAAEGLWSVRGKDSDDAERCALSAEVLWGVPG